MASTDFPDGDGQWVDPLPAQPHDVPFLTVDSEFSVGVPSRTPTSSHAVLFSLALPTLRLCTVLYWDMTRSFRQILSANVSDGEY